MSKTKTVDIVVGTRPNFMKAAPLYAALLKTPIKPVLVHSGQHYDFNMSTVFFNQLSLPEPEVYLNARPGSHASITASVMEAYEASLKERKPDLVVVIGDVDTSMAACIAAKKLQIKVVHLEAGLRSLDMDMPEEVNRLIMDSIVDFHWAPSPDAVETLLREDHAPEKVLEIGNVMIDTLVTHYGQYEAADITGQFDLEPQKYVMVTTHRPSNVKDPKRLATILEEFIKVAETMPVVWPMHPNSRERILAFQGEGGFPENLKLIDPLPYVEFVSMMRHSHAVITDSGGIQEETSFMNVPCLTVRDNTERPVTLTHGTNRLIQPEAIFEAFSQIKLPLPATRLPASWDGKAGERAAAHLVSILLD